MTDNIRRAVLPELSNLAWAPAAEVDAVEMIDRHNGVPTLGLFWVSNEAYLYWRVIGYSGDVSVWLYVPLSQDETDCADDTDGPSILEGIVYGLEEPRYATVGVAERNRIIFEREWQIPAQIGPDSLLGPLIAYVNEALGLAVSSSLPPTRRQAVERAQEVVRQLVPA